MRNLSLVISSACFAFLAFSQSAPNTSAQPSPDKPASVEGTVTNATSGVPIERAHVLVRLVSSSQQQSYGSSTNAEGKFTVRGLPPGSFSVSVERPGFIMPAEHNRTGESFRLAAGDKKEVKLKMIPAGSIVGRVTDEEGNPVLAEVSVEDGSVANTSVGTDEKGQFRIAGLRPGKYRVRAKAAQVHAGMNQAQEIRADGSVEKFNVTTYYPGVVDRRSAARVEVGSGIDAGGVDIQLVRSPVNHVSGRVIGGDGATTRVIQLRSLNGTSRFGGQVGPDGTFTLWRLDPGKVTLSGVALGGIQMETGPVELEIGQQSIEGVELQLRAPTDVSGVVMFEDEGAKPPAPAAGSTPQGPPQRQMISLRSKTGFNGSTAPVLPDGTFVLKAMRPDTYRVSVSWRTGYVRSVRVGNVESEQPFLDLRNGVTGAPVSLTVSSGVAQISGTVSDSKGPLSDVRVALVPRDYQPLGATFTTVTGPDGSYKFQSVVPGKYVVFASDDDDTLVVQGVVDNYEDVMQEVDLREKDTMTKDLKRHAK